MQDDRYYYGHEQFDGDLQIEEDAIYRNCMDQVLREVCYTLSKIQLVTLCYGLSRYFSQNYNTSAAVNVLATHVVLYHFTSDPISSIALFNFISIVSFFATFKFKWSGFKVILLNIAFLIITQFYFGNKYFLSIRGTLMMHAMRLSTLAFENEKNSIDMTLSDCVEYVYFAPTIVFGPYVTTKQFKTMQNPQSWDMNTKTLKMAGKSVMYWYFSLNAVLFSSCFTELATNHFDNSLILDYLDAFSFRTSHYFVSYFGQAVITVLGLEDTVINAMDIEFPRSVVSIVSNWNRPMHTFLHNYIFTSSIVTSVSSKVLFTFSVSALLHGIDFQMTMTLLTLGFIAYCEDNFRRKLATKLSCCVKAKSCSECDHMRQKDSFLAININLIFTGLAIYHLIFTGMTFIDFYAPDGYPITHTIETWQSHYFASFFISFFLLFIAKFVL